MKWKKFFNLYLEEREKFISDLPDKPNDIAAVLEMFDNAISGSQTGVYIPMHHFDNRIDMTFEFCDEFQELFAKIKKTYYSCPNCSKSFYKEDLISTNGKQMCPNCGVASLKEGRQIKK